jgi:hypothetical protein
MESPAFIAMVGVSWTPTMEVRVDAVFKSGVSLLQFHGSETLPLGLFLDGIQLLSG